MNHGYFSPYVPHPLLQAVLAIGKVIKHTNNQQLERSIHERLQGSKTRRVENVGGSLEGKALSRQQARGHARLEGQPTADAARGCLGVGAVVALAKGEAQRLDGPDGHRAGDGDHVGCCPGSDRAALIITEESAFLLVHVVHAMGAWLSR